ncbi:MAG TPA: radical SAM protein, partial [bacterium]|nr:radical SAM protein [bacterium]
QPTLERLFGKGVRKRSAANVADELAARKERFKITGFLFADDTFIADHKWVRSFCSELNARGLGLKWGCNVRADLVTEELLGAMKQAGLGKIYIGIEVYSDECRRDVFNKKLTREQVEKTVDAARKLGVKTQGYFMLGAPGETRSDVRATARYARRLGLDDATFNITTPLPGTYLYDNHRDQVAVAAEDMDYYRRYSFIPGSGLSERWLHRMQVLAYAGFYLRPKRLTAQLAALFSAGGLKRFLSKLRRVL